MIVEDIPAQSARDLQCKLAIAEEALEAAGSLIGSLETARQSLICVASKVRQALITIQSSQVILGKPDAPTASQVAAADPTTK